MLQIPFIPSMLDPATGKPIPDGMAVSRESVRRREKRTAAGVAAARQAAGNEAIATPTLVPIAPASDLKEIKEPRACGK